MKDIDFWELEKSKCDKVLIKAKNNTLMSSTAKNILNKVKENKEKYSDSDTQESVKILNTQNKIIHKNQSLGIDYNTDKKLRLGKYNIDLTVDFHGKTLDEAFDSLIYHINFAYNNNLRCILFITGKGNNSEHGRETIKSSFEHWINHPSISDKIIKYTNATQKDGGSGAVYVLLKRNKDNKDIDY